MACRTIPILVCLHYYCTERWWFSHCFRRIEGVMRLEKRNATTSHTHTYIHTHTIEFGRVSEELIDRPADLEKDKHRHKVQASTTRGRAGRNGR